jgi:hypothetical protein
MLSRQQRVVRAVAPLLVFSISQLYIQASLTSSNTPAQDPQTVATPMTGRLEIHGKDRIRVDGEETQSGATIVSAQTLETSDCSSATVHLVPVGVTQVKEIATVELAANSKAIINYGPGKVTVTLVSGCAKVKSSPGTDATINSPDGASLPADACYPSGSKRDFRPTCVPPGGILPGGGPGAISPAAGIGITAGVFTAIGLTYLNICNRAPDTSPAVPNANQCN